MSRHAAQERPPGRGVETVGSTIAATAPGPASLSLGETAKTLNTSRQVTALGALAAQLSQRAAPAPIQRAAAPPPANRTGLPDRLKEGVEALSGISLDTLRVHRNSAKPAQLQAMAYAQGTDIHLGPGQEQHLPHEAWHVVQQAQGRVKATTQLKSGARINDDVGLEHEADVMGARALQLSAKPASVPLKTMTSTVDAPVQRAAGIEFETSIEARETASYDAAAAPPNRTGWVTQDETMAQGAGWQIDSDNSKLEFVTYPPTDFVTLAATVTTMLDTLSGLPLNLPAAGDLAALLGIPTLKPFTVLPYNRVQFSGAPQGTVGIPFERLFSFFDLLTKYQMTMSEVKIAENKASVDRAWARWRGMPAGNAGEVAAKEQARARIETKQAHNRADKRSHRAIDAGNIATFGQVAAAVNTAIAGLAGVDDATEVAKLKGLLHFIGQYVIFASTPNDGYEKKRFPVMSRSSFASMYAALDATAQAQFRTMADAVITALGFGDDTLLLPGRQGVTFTIGGWMDSIAAPGDVTIPGNPDRVMQSDFMTAPGAKQYEGGPVAMDTDKSMGSMGLDGGLVVVELRDFRLGASANSFSVAAARQLVGDLRTLVEGA